VAKSSHLASNLKYLRGLRGWTQEEIAAKIGIKRSLYGAYEEGRCDANMETLKWLSMQFKVSIHTLYDVDIATERIGIAKPIKQTRVYTEEQIKKVLTGIFGKHDITRQILGALEEANQ
jgi:transcriptional regulator with XRE-family HTH domain